MLSNNNSDKYLFLLRNDLNNMALSQVSIQRIVLEEFFSTDVALKHGLFPTFVFDMTRQVPLVFVASSTSLAMESQMKRADEGGA